MQIIDFNNCPISPKAYSYGGMAGFKDGIIYNNDYWMIKFPKTTKSMDNVEISYTSSPLSEYVGSHIYNILEIDVHETLLGIKNNKIVVACKDFTKDKEPLNEMRTVKNRTNDQLSELLEKSFSSTSSSHIVDIEEILLHLQYDENLSKIPGIFERFYDQIVIDTLINNNDRNNGNWGIMYNPYIQGYQLAPVFDNGAAFNNIISDNKIEEVLQDKNKLAESAMNTITAYGRNNKKITAKKMFAGNLPDDFVKAINRNVPKIQSKMDEIKK